jgi:SMI1 / KNR4 family (SUKH-1)
LPKGVNVLKDVAQLLKEWKPNPGAPREVVEKVQDELGIVFPQDYIDLMETSNGGENWVGKSYLQLWPIEEIPSMNEGYGAPRFAPGVVFIGGDGGGTLYGFDTHFDPPAIVEVDAVSIGIEEDTLVHHMTFTEFLQLLHDRRYDEIDVEAETHTSLRGNNDSRPQT